MGMVDAVKTCFRKYADFSGRASRPEYWWFFLFTVIITAILGILDAAIFGSGAETEEAPRILSGIFNWRSCFRCSLSRGVECMTRGAPPGTSCCPCCYRLPSLPLLLQAW